MENRDQQTTVNRSQTEALICDGLGYCCAYAFFRVHKRTGMIAARLGVTDRTVRYWKSKFKRKELQCYGNATCMLRDLRRSGK
jgi:hypothetical protein